MKLQFPGGLSVRRAQIEKVPSVPNSRQTLMYKVSPATSVDCRIDNTGMVALLVLPLCWQASWVSVNVPVQFPEATRYTAIAALYKPPSSVSITKLWPPINGLGAVMVNHTSLFGVPPQPGLGAFRCWPAIVVGVVLAFVFVKPE